MPQTKEISFSSRSTVKTTDGVSFAYFDETDPNCSPSDTFTNKPDIQNCLLSEDEMYQDNVSVLEGEGLVTCRFPDEISLDIDGSLIINSPDAYKYSIDVDGNLIYDFCA